MEMFRRTMSEAVGVTSSTDRTTRNRLTAIRLLCFCVLCHASVVRLVLSHTDSQSRSWENSVVCQTVPSHGNWWSESRTQDKVWNTSSHIQNKAKNACWLEERFRSALLKEGSFVILFSFHVHAIQAPDSSYLLPSWSFNVIHGVHHLMPGDQWPRYAFYIIECYRLPFFADRRQKSSLLQRTFDLSDPHSKTWYNGCRGSQSHC